LEWQAKEFLKTKIKQLQVASGIYQVNNNIGPSMYHNPNANFPLSLTITKGGIKRTQNKTLSLDFGIIKQILIKRIIYPK
jgi:hypothetical protein